MGCLFHPKEQCKLFPTSSWRSQYFVAHDLNWTEKCLSSLCYFVWLWLFAVEKSCFLVLVGLGFVQEHGIPPETWGILCRSVLSCCRLQRCCSVGVGCSLKERFTEDFGEWYTKLFFCAALMKALASQVPLFLRTELSVPSVQVLYALSSPFPLSKHMLFQMLCCLSFWWVSYLS